MEGVLLPVQNAAEVAVIEGIPIYPIETLPQALEFLCGKLALEPVTPEPQAENPHSKEYELDFTDVKGQHHVKRALEINAGVAIIPKNTVTNEAERKQLVTCRLDSGKHIRPLSLIHKKARMLTPALRSFIDKMKLPPEDSNVNALVN